MIVNIVAWKVGDNRAEEGLKGEGIIRFIVPTLACLSVTFDNLFWQPVPSFAQHLLSSWKYSFRPDLLIDHFSQHKRAEG